MDEWEGGSEKYYAKNIMETRGKYEFCWVFWKYGNIIMHKNSLSCTVKDLSHHKQRGILKYFIEKKYTFNY